MLYIFRPVWFFWFHRYVLPLNPILQEGTGAMTAIPSRDALISRKAFRWRLREGWRSLRNALAVSPLAEFSRVSIRFHTSDCSECTVR